MKATLVIATALAAGFCTVMFIVVVPPTATFVATKDLPTTGAPGGFTVSVALAAVPVSATGPVAVGAVVVLLFVEVAVTTCVMVHVPPGRWCRR